MPYKDKAKQRQYQNERLKTRRLAWIKDNGPCVDCGSLLNLEIDHVDPKTKKFNPGILWSWRKEKRDAELVKCVVRCEECHKKKTKQEKTRPVVHGTRDGYMWHKCRCGLCKHAASKYRNEQRYRTGVRKRPNAGLVQRQESLLGME